jgi:hypothetical protein
LIFNGKKEIKVAGLPHQIRSGIVENTKTDKRHELGKDAHKYSVTLTYQVDPKTHGVYEPPDGFKEELLWKGEIKTQPLTLEFATK